MNLRLRIATLLAVLAGGIVGMTALADCTGCGEFGPGPWQPPSRAWVLHIIEVQANGTITRRGKPLSQLTRAELEQIIREFAGDVVTERGR